MKSFLTVLFLLIKILTYSQTTVSFKIKQSSYQGKSSHILQDNNEVTYDENTAFIYNLNDSLYIGTFMFIKQLDSRKKPVYVYENSSGDLLIIPSSGSYVLLYQDRNGSNWNVITKYFTKYKNI